MNVWPGTHLLTPGGGNRRPAIKHLAWRPSIFSLSNNDSNWGLGVPMGMGLPDQSKQSRTSHSLGENKIRKAIRVREKQPPSSLLSLDITETATF